MRKIVTILLCVLMLSASAIRAADPEQRKFNNPKAGDNKKLEIYYISKVMGNQYWAVVEMGVRKAAEELGVHVTYTGLQNETDVERQTMLLQDALSAKSDAIVIAPCDSTAMVNPINDAFDTGTPIVLIDTIAFTEKYDTCIKTNNYEAGVTCAKMLIKYNKGRENDKLKVGVQVASLGSQTVMDRIKGFKEYWAANAPKGWEVLWDEIKIYDADFQRAINNGQDILMRYPDINMLLATNNGGVLGFATALKELNRKDVCLVGLDFSADAEQLIRQGFIKAVAAQMQYQMGYQGVYAAVDLINNKKVKRLVDTGVYEISMDNINDPKAESVMYPAGRPAATKK